MTTKEHKELKVCDCVSTHGTVAIHSLHKMGQMNLHIH